ncbi:MAG: thiamine phosphate synthase [Muribaculaceae bacterium]|nr:thiamine phosphate synthase [Muribaculaceae bacterium]
MLQYIVSGNNAQEIISTATNALNNGCQWIRLDLKGIDSAEIESTVKTLQEKCNDLEAFLSLENDVENATTMKVGGVHLGNDSKITAVDARKRLGEETIIGITVAEAADVPSIPRTAIDYIAVTNDDLDNCRKVVEQMKATGLEEPVVAPYSHSTPLKTLMSTGINGIAVNQSNTPVTMLPQLLKELNALFEQRLNDL